MGFEPTRAEHIGLAVQRLSHSATQSLCWGGQKINFCKLIKVNTLFFLNKFLLRLEAILDTRSN